MEDLLNETPIEITRVENKSVWISKMDFEYASPKFTTHVNTATLQKPEETLKDIIDFKKKDFTVCPISRQNSKKIDKTLNYQTPLWLHDIIEVIKWTKENTEINSSQYSTNFKKPDTEQVRNNLNFFSKEQLGWDTKKPITE